MKNIPTNKPTILYTITQSIFFLFICITPIYGMKQQCLIIEESVLWNSLPQNIQFKIFACASLESKKILRRTCLQMSSLNIKDILQCSPLVLSQRNLFRYMIETAKENDKETFKI